MHKLTIDTEARVSNPSGLVVYKCVVCGWSSFDKRALMGHMSHGCAKQLASLHVQLPAKLIDEFKDMCFRHNTTTCSLLRVLIDAYLTADKLGHGEVTTGNPLSVVVNEFFGARPRGHGKYNLGELAADPLTAVARCAHLCHRDSNPGRLGWCTDIKRWVTPEICAGCRPR